MRRVCAPAQLVAGSYFFQQAMTTRFSDRTQRPDGIFPRQRFCRRGVLFGAAQPALGAAALLMIAARGGSMNSLTESRSGEALAAGAFLELARADRKKGALESAHDLLLAGLRQAPQDPALLREMAELAGARRDWNASADSWSALVAIEGERATADDLAKLGRAAREAGRLEAAEDAVISSLERHPGHLALMQEMAALAALRRDWTTAAENLEAVVVARGAKASAGLLAKLARACRELERLDEAQRWVARGMELHPDNQALIRQAAEVAMAQEDWPTASAHWKALARTEGAAVGPGVFARWYISCRNGGDMTGALEALSSGLRMHPDDVHLRNHRVEAEVIRERGGFERLLRHAGGGKAAARSRVSSIEELCACFWKIERELKLLDWQSRGVHPWPLMRMQLYYAVTQKLGLFDSPHPALGAQGGFARSEGEPIEAFWRGVEARFEGLRKRGPMAGLLGKLIDRRRYAVLMATKKINGSEPYSNAVRVEIGSRALLLDNAADGSVMPGAVNLLKLQHLFRARYQRPEHLLIARDDQMRCEEIREAFFRELGTDVGDLARSSQRRVADFLALHEGFNIFFGVNPVQILFLTNAYGVSNCAALTAARKNGARVIELQHGLITKFHLGYSWPDRPQVPYRPDELWCFGAYWPESTPLAAQVRTRVIGAPYVRALAASARGQREQDLVVFTSQGVVGRRLFDLALETARRRPDRRIVFRLHPNEALPEYAALLREQGDAPGNFSLSHKNPNIFSLLATAAIQVGAFSTTLFEGMTLGTRTVVLDLPGSEYMRPVVERGDALFVRNIDELVTRLDEAPLAADPSYYYAPAPARLL